MKRIESIWRRLKLVTITVAFWLAMYGHVLAAKKEKVVEKSEGSSQTWVFPYFVVLMAIGLGMLIVCRSSRRTERAKPKGYESLNTSE